jgi:hypothetical protein
MLCLRFGAPSLCLASILRVTARELAERELKKTERTAVVQQQVQNAPVEGDSQTIVYSDVLHRLLLPHLLFDYQFAPPSARGLGVLRAPRTASSFTHS